jgi:hypothetical protein
MAGRVADADDGAAVWERFSSSCPCLPLAPVLHMHARTRRASLTTPPTHKQTPQNKNNSLADATAKASKEFKEYSHCLDLTAGKYAYCRPEKAKFEEAFPLLKE